MKLLMCMECTDIFNLTLTLKTCRCKESSGKYIDNANVEVKGNCKLISFGNESFRLAYKMQEMDDEAQAKANKPCDCEGARFTAFFIPETAKTVKRIT
jgi:hypothetical protein